MKQEIEFYRKYSPSIFHENTYKNIESGLRIYDELEKSLSS
ncbi:MAG: hypothetical protein ABI721_00175 [Candidatus Dojkabacteria bacterium]